MLTQHVALVPDTDGLSPSDLARVSAALQKQVTRDIAPIWGIRATVDAFPHLEEVPLGYLPIIISYTELGSQAGVHVDRNGQPYAWVEASAHWSLHASRVCLEMLINPVEQRTVVAAAPRADRGPVEVLVDISGPCSIESAYTVNEVLVSDFCTPAFFGLRTPYGEGCSFTRAIAGPFQVQRGGHMAWYDPISDDWWLRSYWGEHPLDTRLGALDRKLISVREFVQACASLRARASNTLEPQAARSRALHAQASGLRAARLRALPETRLEAQLEPAFEGLRRRQDVYERVERSFVGAPSTASGQNERSRASEERLDGSFDRPDDEPRTPAQPKATSGAHRSTTIRPPMPRASTPPAYPSSAPVATAAQTTWPPGTVRTTSFPPVVWSVPPSDGTAANTRGTVRNGILIAGAVAGSAWLALTFGAHHPSVRSAALGSTARPELAGRLTAAPSVAPASALTATQALPVPVAATPVPQVASSQPCAATTPVTLRLQAAKPVTASLASATIAVEAHDARVASRARRATVQDPPSPTDALNERPHEAQLDDAIEALIDSRR